MTHRFASLPRGGDTCTQVRLAESDLIAIDSCSCGAMRVHLGVLTLRVSPEALAQVAETLEQALRVHASQPGRPSLHLTAALKRPRGQS